MIVTSILPEVIHHYVDLILNDVFQKQQQLIILLVAVYVYGFSTSCYMHN